ncbi:hypothetical protein GCM10010303_25580 [Streptomyces purpurascens]|nr:hypothetical protein GCM10010303_25580 [Streptomyces purpurascens]
MRQTLGETFRVGVFDPRAAGESAEAGEGFGVQDEEGGSGHEQPFLQPCGEVGRVSGAGR